MSPKLVPELIVSDLAASLAFYTGVLGFRVLYDRPEERFAYLERDGVELMLEQPLRRDRLWPAAALEHPYGRGVNFQIEVAAVDPLWEAVLAAGAVVHLPLEERWYGRGDGELGNRQFAVLDPDGYMLRLFTDLGARPRT